MYLFINENEVRKYNGEVLKRYIGGTLVKAISNPTEEHLKEFGYKPLNDTVEVPEYDPDTQYLEIRYTDTEDKIIPKYEVVQIPEVTDDEH